MVIAPKVTINDVAKLANVHKSTVSRVLSGTSGVSLKTKSKVLHAVEQLDFTPNKSAQSLAKGFNGIIGIVYSEQEISEVTVNPYFSSVIKGISSFASKYGVNILLITAAGFDFKAYTDVIRGRAIDGLIINGSSGNRDLYRMLDQNGLPYVSIGNPEIGGTCHFIEFDDYEGGFLAADHLIRNGHRNIRLIVNPVRGNLLLHNRQRVAGFLDALSAAGLDPRDEPIVYAPMGADESYRFLTGYCRGRELDGLVISNEVTAIAALHALVKENGLEIPRDMSLIAFGDRASYGNIRPVYTRIDRDAEWTGHAAAEMLWKLIQNEELEGNSILKRSGLVEGETTRSRLANSLSSF